MRIITNKHQSEILYWCDLTDKERQEFDYLNSEERQQEASFVRYRGATYDLGEFLRCHNTQEFAWWHGYQSDTYFSGILCRYTRDHERVIMGRYWS